MDEEDEEGEGEGDEAEDIMEGGTGAEGLDATGVETPLVDGISSVASGLTTPGVVDLRKGIRYVEPHQLTVFYHCTRHLCPHANFFACMLLEQRNRNTRCSPATLHGFGAKRRACYTTFLQSVLVRDANALFCHS